MCVCVQGEAGVIELLELLKEELQLAMALSGKKHTHRASALWRYTQLLFQVFSQTTLCMPLCV